MGLRRAINIDLTLTNESCEQFGVQTRVLMRKGAGESWAHVLMKFASYAMFYHPELHIERSVGQHYKPDLVRVDLDGIVRQWIDCGVTSIRKLDRITRANPHAIIKIVKPRGGTVRRFKQQAEDEIRLTERVDYFGFEPQFLDELEKLIHSRHEVSAVVSGNLEHLYLSVDGTGIDSRITWLRGEGRV